MGGIRKKECVTVTALNPQTPSEEGNRFPFCLLDNKGPRKMEALHTQNSAELGVNSYVSFLLLLLFFFFFGF